MQRNTAVEKWLLVDNAPVHVLQLIQMFLAKHRITYTGAAAYLLSRYD